MLSTSFHVHTSTRCVDRDHQWIHKEGAQTPFGGPVAHGFLTLSLLPSLLKGVLPAQPWVAFELNYGFERVRFVSPVPMGARVRARAKLISVKPLEAMGPASAPGSSSGASGTKRGVESLMKVVVEREGMSEKPALVADWVTRQYEKVVVP